MNTTNRPPAVVRARAARLAARTAGVLLAGGALAAQGWPVHSAARSHPLPALLCVLLGAGLAWLPHPGRWWRAVLRMPDRAFAAAVFAVSAAVNLYVARYVFGGIPRLDDGVGALFQARIFARGRVVLPLPPDAGFYEVFGVLGNAADLGHWCGMYPPGWPALLTPGVWLGAPWIVNPLLGAGLVVLIAKLGADMFGRATGRTAALLALGSPFVVVLSALHLSHVPTAFFACLCLLAIRRMLRTGRWIFGLGAGLAWGMAFLCRPMTALVVGAAFGVYVLTYPGRLRRNLPALVAAALAASLAAGLYMLFLHATTHDPTLPGHKIGLGAYSRFGFGAFGKLGRTHTPLRGAVQSVWRLRAINDNLFGWLVPSLPLAALPLLLGRRRREDGLLPAPFLLLLGTFACFWYYEEYFPARYTFCALPLLFVLGARGLVLARRRLRSSGRPAVRRLVAAFAGVNVLFLVFVSTPSHFRRYDARFADVEGVLPQVVQAYGLTNAVVAMDAVFRARDLVGDPLNDYYATGFMLNDLDLRNDVIFVRNSRNQNWKLLRRYPGRALYLYRYHRTLDRALLYRMIPEGRALRFEPFPADGRLLAEAPPLAPTPAPSRRQR